MISKATLIPVGLVLTLITGVNYVVLIKAQADANSKDLARHEAQIGAIIQIQIDIASIKSDIRNLNGQTNPAKYRGH